MKGNDECNLTQTKKPSCNESTKKRTHAEATLALGRNGAVVRNADGAFKRVEIELLCGGRLGSLEARWQGARLSRHKSRRGAEAEQDDEGGEPRRVTPNTDVISSLDTKASPTECRFGDNSTNNKI